MSFSIFGHRVVTISEQTVILDTFFLAFSLFLSLSVSFSTISHSLLSPRFTVTLSHICPFSFFLWASVFFFCCYHCFSYILSNIPSFSLYVPYTFFHWHSRSKLSYISISLFILHYISLYFIFPPSSHTLSLSLFLLYFLEFPILFFSLFLCFPS